MSLRDHAKVSNRLTIDLNKAKRPDTSSTSSSNDLKHPEIKR